MIDRICLGLCLVGNAGFALVVSAGGSLSALNGALIFTNSLVIAMASHGIGERR